MSKKTTILLFILALGVVTLVVLLSKRNAMTEETTSGLSSSTALPFPEAQQGGVSQSSNDEFSSLLSNISRISIDTSLFTNPAYLMLRNYPVALGTDVIGRANPFAPVGSDSQLAPGSSAVMIQTLQPGKITSTSAEFGAQITLSDTIPTSIVFEYGVSDTFGNPTAPVTVTKSGTTLLTVTQLLPETTYYVRAVAVRGGQTITSQTMSFITPKATVRR